MWVDIPDFPNYQVHANGTIRNKRTEQTIKPFSDRYGYLRVSLGNADNVYIHKIVAKTFYGSPEDEKSQVNHIDSDRQNNHVLNLEYCSPSENIKWAYTNGKLDPSKGLNKAREANLKPVKIVELNKTFPCVKDCADFLNVRPTNVSRNLVGSRKGQKLHGYHVEYV